MQLTKDKGLYVPENIVSLLQSDKRMAKYSARLYMHYINYRHGFSLNIWKTGERHPFDTGVRGVSFDFVYDYGMDAVLLTSKSIDSTRKISTIVPDDGAIFCVNPEKQVVERIIEVTSTLLG